MPIPVANATVRFCGLLSRQIGAAIALPFMRRTKRLAFSIARRAAARYCGATSGFVSGGYQRARSAAEPVIRAAVRMEFAAELEAASVECRYIVRRRMDREIKRRLERIAPANGLY